MVRAARIRGRGPGVLVCGAVRLMRRPQGGGAVGVVQRVVAHRQTELIVLCSRHVTQMKINVPPA
ncbi:hypothetical protein GCM10010329_82970 [Streptomyces spiroverticillatus]|uniref:Uncharacterized protein n=1 Tax=Streptomyces finlayi TaxID=67296 RepID=A0A918X8U4_9ACTN|nr:hypothetical protein GCM10010329_82970 [Streptomyces spiroverticillatus]GHD18833.1 hypothetical protein GCM10010334_82030 [Streptomyces finlayi]